MSNTHLYTLQINWQGNLGSGTSKYDAYSRNFDLHIKGKPILHCSSDILFRGEAEKLNPEDFLLASLSSCHMLWYLHLCADAGIVVTSYTDEPEAILDLNHAKGGRFTSATIKPIITIVNATQINLAQDLHTQAHGKCFIANSVNFKITIEALISAQ
jgi:organic hydroperoxide reductase OsmC/OhrA